MFPEYGVEYIFEKTKNRRGCNFELLAWTTMQTDSKEKDL
jgi:hypothetical protein